MRRFILTGPPGAGKTSILNHLREQGYSVVEEAVTDLIAIEQKNGVDQPWSDPRFIEKILDLQIQRPTDAMSASGEIQFFDRAPLDTCVLCQYMGFPVSPALLQKFREAQSAGQYERVVFFIESLGFIEPTAVRRISYEDALRFGQMHEDRYKEWGYECVKISASSVANRVEKILKHLP